MKMGPVIVGVIVVIVVAVGVYYAFNVNASHNSIMHNSTSSIQHTTTQYSTSISQQTNPTVSSVPSSMATTTITGTVQDTTTIRGSSGPYTVEIAQNSSLGTYLTNGTGYTLYYYMGDRVNSNTSNCNGGCANAWPPFYSQVLNLPQGLSASSFKTIIRNDGSKQLTYNGLPLYYFKQDLRSGEVSGNGVGGFSVASIVSH